MRGLLKKFYNGNINVHNNRQDQLELKEHAVDRRGWANIQFWRYHQVPVEEGILYAKLHLFCDQVESRQPQEQYATYLQQVELFMKIPTAECNNERRRKNLS